MIQVMDETFFWDQWDLTRARRILKEIEENNLFHPIEKDVRESFDLDVIDWRWLKIWSGATYHWSGVMERHGTTTIPERCDT